MCACALQEDEPTVAELLQPGQKALLSVGGRGGRGNHSFKTRLNTAPTIAEKGEAGPEQWFDLELKVCVRVCRETGERQVRPLLLLLLLCV